MLTGWTNIDFESSRGALAHDLRAPLPLAADSFDFVYHSHVLEHLEKADARRLLSECHRVLKPGGTVRVVVPDLESKARLYLEKLSAAHADPSIRAREEHEWTIVELIDQMVRTETGGQMLLFLASGRGGSLASSRIGDEATRVPVTALTPKPHTQGRSGLNRLGALLRRLGGVTNQEWELLQFRRRGEVHLWMYDRVSLKALLEETGFTEVRITNALQSRLPAWDENGAWLDVEDGRVRKPDSLFMEAVKAVGAQ